MAVQDRGSVGLMDQSGIGALPEPRAGEQCGDGFWQGRLGGQHRQRGSKRSGKLVRGWGSTARSVYVQRHGRPFSVE